MIDTMRTAVVTGASSGIGAAFARRLSDDGWHVFGLVRSSAHRTELERLDGVTPVMADLRDDPAVSDACKQIAERGELGLLINCAGILAAGTLASTPLSVWTAAFETNVIGTLRLTKHLLPFLRHPAGRIVVVSSVAAAAVVSPQSPYTASKAALEASFEALSQEVRADGTRVLIAQPGVVPTPMLQNRPLGADTLQGSELVLAERLASLVRQQLQEPTPAEAVVDEILTACLAPDPPLRLPVGDDARELVDHRRLVDDRVWAAWWCDPDGASWRDGYHRNTGLTTPP